MSSLQEKLRLAIDEILALDDELADEFARTERGENEAAGRSGPHLEGLETDGAAIALKAREFELLRPVLLPNPVFVVADGKPRLDVSAVKSAVWKQRLEEAGEPLVSAIRAVGRIEVQGLAGSEWVGTGVLVGDDVVATNQHVAKDFGAKGPAGFIIKSNLSGRLMRPSIDFVQEADRDDTLVFRIVEVLHLQPDELPDVALLRVARATADDEPLPQPLKLASRDLEVAEHVVAIGYPKRDSSAKHAKLMADTFGDVFDKKRLAPGQVRRIENGVVVHDCSVLSGNSGSPLISLETGEVVGLHFEGEFLGDNHAVPAAAVAKLLETVPPREEEAHEGLETTALAAVPAADGSVATVTIPIHVTVTVGSPIVTPGTGRVE